MHQVQDEVFESIGTNSGDPGTCTSDVKAKIDEIYGIARSRMESNFKQKIHSDCAMKEVEKDSKYEVLLLTAEVVNMKGVGMKFWKISSKNTKIEQLQNQAQELVNNAIIRCKGQSDYGAFFDSFYEQKSHEPLAEDFDYCMRKHLVNIELISSTVYNFKVNPNNVRTGTIDCDSIMKTALIQMKASITEAGSPCVVEAFINSGYLDLIMKIQLLSKLTLTQDQKLAEKRKFIDAMIEMTHQIKTCPL